MKFSSLPVLIYIPPSGEPVDKIEIPVLGLQAEIIAKWVEMKTKERVCISMKICRLFMKLRENVMFLGAEII